MRSVVLWGASLVIGVAGGCALQQPQAPLASPDEPPAAPTKTVTTPVAVSSHGSSHGRVDAATTPASAVYAERRGADGAFTKSIGPLRDVRMAADHGGLVVVASGGCSDEPGPLLSGPRDPGRFVLLAKLDEAGRRQWSKSFFAACGDSPGEASAPAIAGVGVDKVGNIYIAGDISLASGSLDFGGGALADGGGRDAFVASFDASGQHRWSKRFGNAADQRVHSVAVSPEGLVGITGTLEGSADFGNGVIKSAGKGDAFVAVFDAAGQHIASHAFGDAGDQRGDLIAFGKMGELTLVGPYEGAIDFGGGPLTTAKTSRTFLAQYADNGPGATPRYAFAFSKALPADAVVGAIAAGADGTYLAGSFRGTVDFGAGPLKAHEPDDKSAPATDAFVAKIDAAGKCAFAKSFGLGGTHRIEALVVAGDLWMAGELSGMTRFTETMISAGGTDALLVRLDADKGEPKQAWRFGDTFAQSLSGLASDGSPSWLYLLARSNGTIDFGEGPESQHGTFLARMAAEAPPTAAAEPEPPTARGDGGTR